MNDRVASILINAGWFLVAMALIFGPVSCVVARY